MAADGNKRQNRLYKEKMNEDLLSPSSLLVVFFVPSVSPFDWRN